MMIPIRSIPLTAIAILSGLLCNCTTSSPGNKASATRSPSDAKPAPPSTSAAVKTTKGDYPYATKMPGKEGYVLSPYTGKKINVVGMPRGTLVVDPTIVINRPPPPRGWAYRYSDDACRIDLGAKARFRVP